MDRLTLKVFVLGELSNNCYLVFDKESKKGFIIDCPWPTAPLIEFIQDNNIDIAFIALTHAHFDHIGGLNDFPAPFYIHSDDTSFLNDPQLNGSAFFSHPVTTSRKPVFYDMSKPLLFEDYSIDVIHTPGHTPGSVSLSIGQWLFSGDTLFYRSVGRTNIPYASESALFDSIRNKLFSLPADTIVYPGHGQSTTIGEEKVCNTFLE